MSDWTVAELAEDFKAGRVTRRHFITRMLGAGLTLPVISAVLAACGSSNTTKSASNSNSGASSNQAAAGTSVAGGAAPSAQASSSTFNPTKRGGGGVLKVLWWQGPTILNPHLSTGTKDYDGSRVFYETLAEFDQDAKLYPVLAAEIPSIENGGVAKDGTSVTWKLKQGVTWHDGQPFTADDVVFTYQYVTDPTTGSPDSGSYVTIGTVDKVDDHTIKITFKSPTPFWQSAFTGYPGMIIPKHIFEQFKGKDSRNAPNNLKPVGTGPYKFVSFVPGDSLVAEINQNYHIQNRPFFDRFELKGGGDATSAARAVLQTGDYDYGWNIQVDYTQLTGLEKGGAGRIVIFPGSASERIKFNFTDPNKVVNGEFSSLQAPHPFFTDQKVRQAFALAFNRQVVTDQLYGKEGATTTYIVYNPKSFLPDQQSKWEYNLQKAGQMLDEAGWKKGSDGMRAKDGVKMKVLFQTSDNQVRKDTQALIKKDLESLGIPTELKAVNANVYFGDSTNPDSYPQFHADMQMYTNGLGFPDPQSFMRGWVSSIKGTDDNIAQKSNNWSGNNVTRYRNPNFDQLWKQAATEVDPTKRADLYKKMNQILFDDAPEVPLVARNGVSVAKNNLQGMDLEPWASSDLARLAYWYRKG